MPIKTDDESALRYGRALYDIQALMSGREWSSATLDEIGAIMMREGFYLYDSAEGPPHWASTGSGLIELQLSLDEAKSASHQGQCDDDVEALSKLPHIRAQLDDIDPDLLRRELKEYGAWDADQLADHEQNLQRLLWSLAGDIVEQQGPANAWGAHSHPTLGVSHWIMHRLSQLVGHDECQRLISEALKAPESRGPKTPWVTK